MIVGLFVTTCVHNIILVDDDDVESTGVLVSCIIFKSSNMALATAMAVVSMDAIPIIIIYFVLAEVVVVVVDLSMFRLLLLDLIIIISSFPSSDIGIFAAKRQAAEAARRRDGTDCINNEAVVIAAVVDIPLL